MRAFGETVYWITLAIWWRVTRRRKRVLAKLGAAVFVLATVSSAFAGSLDIGASYKYIKCDRHQYTFDGHKYCADEPSFEYVNDGSGSLCVGALVQIPGWQSWWRLVAHVPSIVRHAWSATFADTCSERYRLLLVVGRREVWRLR